MNPYGRGYSLYLCKFICDSIDGKILYSGDQAKGSLFTFRVKAQLLPKIKLPIQTVENQMNF